MKRITINVLGLVLLATFANALHGAIPAGERQSLISIYNTTSGMAWWHDSGWRTGPLAADGFAMPGTEGTWFGVTVTNDHVTQISLNQNNLRGSFPVAVCDLTYLKSLSFHGNASIKGPISPQIGNLTALEHLDLGYLDLTGGIPPEIGNLVNLTYLDISYNWELEGPIPPEIGNLTRLVFLDLSLNSHQTGPIPPEIGNLTHLEYLDIGYNSLSGTIPIQIGNLTRLKEFKLASNQLSGAIPREIGNLKSLQDLNLGQNQLSGAIPCEIGNIAGLQKLILSYNQLTGAIPAEIGNLKSLAYLSLGENQLTGAIPSQIGNLTSLHSLLLGKNQLTGAIPGQIGNLKNLSSLHLNANQLTGGIPVQIGYLKKLWSLTLEDNRLTGIIPAWIGTLTKLENLGLGSNRFTGPIPSQIGNLINLVSLHLHSNQLAGAIPASLTNLTRLGFITVYESCNDCTEIGNNSLYSNNATLIDFLNENDYDWKDTQTVAPTNVHAATAGDSTVNLTWDAIRYSGDPGGYRIFVGTASGGPYVFYQQTADKIATSLPVTGLNAGKRYYFVIRTRTEAHGDQQNIVESGNSAEASAATLPGSIAVTSPAAGALWERGMTCAITWLKQGTQNANVRIVLYKGTSTLVSTISAKTANDGAFDWTVPATLAAGSAYFIKVQTSDNLVKANSGKFSIIVPTIRITSPTSGTIWAKGTTNKIAWTKTGTQDANVRIQLFKDAIKKLDISLSTPNSDSFDWAIPSTLINGTYVIKVITLDGKVKGTSKGFSIVKTAGLTLTTPNGGENLHPVAIQPIRWTDDPNVLEVKLEFSRDNGGSFTTIADHAPNTGKYDWIVPVNFTRNGIIRVSDASGRPWLEDGLLELSLKFIYNGEGKEPGAALWFGGSDPKDPGYEFAKIGIGHTQVQFGGLSKPIEPLDGNWHELHVRFDFRRDTAEIRLDEQPLFENAPLGTTRERYFQPLLVLQAGGENALDLSLDDLNINMVQLDDLRNDKLLLNVLKEDFERYDDSSNGLQNCWQGLSTIDRENKIDLNVDSSLSKSLRLRIEAGKQLMIWLPFSLPERVPFDISDKCFKIENQ